MTLKSSKLKWSHSPAADRGFIAKLLAYCLTYKAVHSSLYKNVVFPAQAEYFYFSADFRLKIFLYYS